jgi:hypothetical protein
VKAFCYLLPLVIALREVANKNLIFALGGLNDSFDFFAAMSSPFSNI